MRTHARPPARTHARAHARTHTTHQVGYLPWMVPSTSDTIKNLATVRGTKTMMLVPVAFTSDHIETLFEIGIE